MKVDKKIMLHFFVISIFTLIDASDSENSSNDTFHLVEVNFKRVEHYMKICLWLLVAILAKIVFHHFKKISNHIPESCLLILLGFIIGAVIRYGKLNQGAYFDSEVFFFILLPPIVLDAGYFSNTSAFFDNFWTIISFAINGTLFNAMVVGALMVACRQLYNFDLPLTWVQGFLFGAIVSAVDPVAVLAVFDELHVNDTLYIIVFGESILNDAVTVVLYNLFTKFVTYSEISPTHIALGVVMFLIDALGGTLIGLTCGILGAMITRFTKHLSVMEPLLILLTAYFAYLSAEIFHFSGILGIFFCGILLKYYTEINVSNQSRTAIKYFIKTLSSSAETYIFMQLGVSLFTTHLEWDTSFCLLALTFIIVIRFIGVFLLTFLANAVSQTRKIGFIEQLVMGYGGLRGAVAFSLALILPESHYKDEFVTAVIFIVLFTCFIQGISIKPLVKLLKVRMLQEKDDSIFGEVNDAVVQKLVKGVNSILGVIEYDFVKNILNKIDQHILRKIILRVENLKQYHQFLLKNREILYREAEGLVDTNPAALLSSRERLAPDDMTQLNRSTILHLKNDEYTEHEPMIDYNMMEKLKKHQTKLETPTVALMVGKKLRSPKNKYTLAGIGEEDNAPMRRHASRKVDNFQNFNRNVPQIVVDQMEGDKPKPQNAELKPIAPKILEDSQENQIERILKTTPRFKKDQAEPDDLTGIPTVAQVSVKSDPATLDQTIKDDLPLPKEPLKGSKGDFSL